MAPLKLPLPPNFFTCPPLSSDEINYFRAVGLKCAEDIIAKAKVMPHMWTLIADDRDLQIYKAATATDNTPIEAGRSLHCAKMEVAATMDEAVALFRADSDIAAKAYTRRFGHIFLDALTLYTILPRSTRRPNDFMQIKWMAGKSPIDGLVAKRDVCFLETTLDVQVDGGKRAWVRAIVSVQLPSVPNLQHSHGLIRARHYGTGQLFVESDRPGYLCLTSISDVDVRGSAVEWAREQANRHYVRSLHHFDRYLREDRLSRMPTLRPDDLCRLNSRRRCFACEKMFGSFLRRKSNCSKCGEVFCDRCNGVWSVPGARLPVRACIPCSVKTSTKWLKEPPRVATFSAAPAATLVVDHHHPPPRASSSSDDLHFRVVGPISVNNSLSQCSDDDDDDDQSHYSESVAWYQG
ncbi:Aste57867_801 [Aphanomyces stellatus]|uniref:Aste57867_801 protein n=1 Tax=Aphanomyces stellatus TaxID=120398 RepID=A0A485K8J9_9STRA|nr:hypothetical protein As57867_000800 [Aphanomyces stellatus]VFT78025.1 Aste57867_801 [Aphanomyces stellatus]